MGGITDIRLEKSKNSSLKSDVVFDYDHTSRTFSAHIEEYIADRCFVPTITCDGIDRIEGSYFTIMGLPVHMVYQELLNFIQ